MFVVFVGALTVFLIIGMLLAWLGNKILLSILKDNAKAEKEIKERKILLLTVRRRLRNCSPTGRTLIATEKRVRVLPIPRCENHLFLQ